MNGNDFILFLLLAVHIKSVNEELRQNETECICPGSYINDEYAYCIPNPVATLAHQGKGIYQVPKINTMSAELLHRAMLPLLLPYKDLATASLPAYVATHSLKTDYLAPLRTQHQSKGSQIPG